MSDTFTLAADDGAALFVYRFLPQGPPKALVHIAHGMAEHAARYARLANVLTAAGYAVYANDHRGHGNTATTPADRGFFASTGGWERVQKDLALLIAHEKNEHPGLPVTLMGHSMGSFITQSFALTHAAELKAIILSASNGKPSLLAQAGRLIARIERLRLGERGKSKLITSLSFGAFNKQFAPNRTPFDWLSRDNAEVDKYLADPLCGFECTTTLWIDVLDANAQAADPKKQANLPHELPIYIFSGSRDPVGENLKGIERLVSAYQKAGLTKVTSRFYEGARHETINEINRDEVMGDLVAWLDGVHR